VSHGNRGGSGGILTGRQRSQRRGQNVKKEGSFCTRMVRGWTRQQRWQNACTRDGTARRCAEVEHARMLQTAVRVPAAMASREGYAERTLSVRHCPG
jgi:hypothetical protein